MNDELCKAVKNGDANLVQDLIKRGANPNGIRSDGDAPLHLAISFSRNEIARYLLTKGANANLQRPIDGAVPLIVAANKGNPDCVKLLLEYGADVHAKLADSRNALWFAIRGSGRLEKQIEIIKYLVERGANVNTVFSGAEVVTPLHIAMFAMDTLAIVGCLIDLGANINSRQTEGGFSPLHLASFKSNRDLVSLLIGKGAEVNAKNNNDETPLSLAWLGNGPFNRKTMQMLLEAGADPNCCDNSGMTLLMRASSKGDCDTIWLLIKNGADVNARGSGACSSETALMRASNNGRLAAVRQLVENGADVRAKTSEGYTAADFAKRKGHTELAQYLEGAKKTVQSSQEARGRTCFIATAACTTEHAPAVIRLKQFRDQILNQSRIGNRFVKMYEYVSPPLAQVIAQSELAQRIVRFCIIRPIAKVAEYLLRKL